MEHDEENEDPSEDNEEEQEDRALRTYSKKKYFGKTTSDLKLLRLRNSIRFRKPALKALKPSLQHTLSKPGAFLVSALKLKHRGDMGPLTASSKLNISFKNRLNLEKWDCSLSVKKKVAELMLGMSFKANSKREGTLRWTQESKFLENWKWKSFIETQHKWGKGTQLSYGCTLNRKRTCVPSWLMYIAQYNEVMGLSFSGKACGKRKVETSYKGHVATGEGHKFFIEHKCSREIGAQAPLINSVAASYQESLGIGTLNGFLSFENSLLKTREFRFVIEFEKRLAFGLQKRNEVFELMLRRSKIGYSWLRQVQVSAGNRGFLGTLEGRATVWRVPLDYTLSYKLRQIQNNFYQDSSLGFSFKVNC